MVEVEAPPRRAGFGRTRRPDAWWLAPAGTFAVLGAFVVYTTWAAFQGEHYTSGPYLSPYYSPVLFGDPAHAWFGPEPAWWPDWLVFSPAILILWIPGGFRLTCYYYRGAYYKAFWGDPPACAVGEPRKSYWGENSFPLVLQNLHRFFIMIAIPFLGILTYDVWKSVWFEDAPGGAKTFGIGLGTVILAVNVILLGAYVLGCHSLRHLVGGFLDQPSRYPLHLRAWRCVSCLNRRHMTWAWSSLVSVMFADIYVRLCSMGVWTDWRIL